MCFFKLFVQNFFETILMEIKKIFVNFRIGGGSSKVLPSYALDLQQVKYALAIFVQNFISVKSHELVAI